MPTERIVRGGHVNSAVVGLAKQLRREMTPEEKRLWECLRGNRLGGRHFRRMQVIGGYIADFYCHSVGLVVEVDGKWHATQVEYDTERDRVIAEQGIYVLRVTNDEVRQNLPGVIARIAALCRERSGT
ncbi:MAG: DUF559 domain-containing protein [Anaerolineae bacterium]|nr:DUF559 domain-containing protein [Anaerolineae bacterium]